MGNTTNYKNGGKLLGQLVLSLGQKTINFKQNIQLQLKLQRALLVKKTLTVHFEVLV